MKIIVIGAGIAGLAAAQQLILQGHTVTVLEARERIGGRICTDYSLGIPLSLGAQWIHGTQGNPIAEMVDRLSLKHIPTEFTQMQRFDCANNIIKSGDSSHFLSDLEASLMECKQYALNQLDDVSLFTALNAIYSDMKYSPYAPERYQQILLYSRLYFNADPHLLSACYGDEEQRFPGGNEFMLDGYMPLCQQLAKNLDIQLNAIVTGVTDDGTQVTVMTQQQTYSAEAVIVTVPLGALKNNAIQFEPALPTAFRQSIDRLSMGIHDTLALKFDALCWPKEAMGFCFLNPDVVFPIVHNFYPCYGAPILACKIGGEIAAEYENLTDAEWIAKALQQLRAVFGDIVTEPSDYVIKRWGKDPFSHGSYSYIPVGASGGDYHQLSIPVTGRLFFAGEATNQQYPATVHGAYLSGLRVAEQIANIEIR